MAVVDYAGNKFNFTSEITNLEKELTDCHTKIESLSEQQAQFEQHPPFVSNRLLMIIIIDCFEVFIERPSNLEAQHVHGLITNIKIL